MPDRAESLAEAIVRLRPDSVLVVGPAPPPLAAALRGRGMVVTEMATAPNAGSYGMVVWYPDLDSPSVRQIAARLGRLSDAIVVAAASPASAWAEAFAVEGFYLDIDCEMPSALPFRRVAGGLPEVTAARRELVRLQDQVGRLHRLLEDKDRLIATLRRDVVVIETSLGWRLLQRVRGAVARALRIRLARALYPAARRALELLLEEGFRAMVRRAVRKVVLGRSLGVLVRNAQPGDLDSQYQRWLERRRSEDLDEATSRAALERLSATPVVSLLSVLGVADPALVHQAVATLQRQIYPHWQLCLAMPAAVHGALKSEIDDLSVAEPRIAVAMAEVDSAGLGDAMRVATGALIGVLDPGDLLAPDALLELVAAFEQRPGPDLVYSDEDVVDAEGRRGSPFFKPEWSPDLLLAANYLGRLTLARRSAVEAVGGPRSEFGPGAAYDLWLRVTERTDRIARVPKMLCHRRRPDPTSAGVPARADVVAMEREALREALRRRGLDGDVEPLPLPLGVAPAFLPRFRLRGRPLVSLVIPTRDRRHLLEQAIRSVLDRTGYDRYEIVVVDNDSRDPETLAFLERLAAPCRVVRWPGSFNFSAICNFGARQADGEYLLFLNNDVEVLRPDWLAAMLEHAQRPEVGVVGAKLLYPDGRIQHAGVVVGVGGGAAHAFCRWPGEPTRELRLADLTRNCSAVTAACMMVPRSVFEQVRGFDEALRVAFNDVDLCLRIRALGRLVVYTPRALLIHWEGATRGRLHPDADDALFRRRWAATLARGDPYYHPALTDVCDDWSLKM
jgi:GT2 family glycosyltransferase